MPTTQYTFSCEFYLASNLATPIPQGTGSPPPTSRPFAMTTAQLGFIGQKTTENLILHTGEHYDYYASTSTSGVVWRPMTFRGLTASPLASFVALPAKKKAAAVTGHIGEALAVNGLYAVTGQPYSAMPFLRLIPKGKYRAPDVLFQTNRSLLAQLWNLSPSAENALPDFIPMEVKSIATARKSAYPWDAIGQLQSYWQKCMSPIPSPGGGPTGTGTPLPASGTTSSMAAWVGYGLIARPSLTDGVIRYYLFIPKAGTNPLSVTPKTIYQKAGTYFL